MSAEGNTNLHVCMDYNILHRTGYTGAGRQDTRLDQADGTREATHEMPSITAIRGTGMMKVGIES